MIIDALKAKIKEHLDFTNLKDGDPILIVTNHDSFQFNYYQVIAKDFDGFDFSVQGELADALHFPLKNSSVNGVVLFSAASIITNGLTIVMREAKRVARSGARIVMCEEVAPSSRIYSEFQMVHNLTTNKLLFNYDMAHFMLVGLDSFKWEHYVLTNRSIKEYANSPEEVGRYRDLFLNRLSGALLRGMQFNDNKGSLFVSRKFLIASAKFFDSEGYLNMGWWDGPDRFRKINRNVVSAIQRDIFHKMVLFLAPGNNGWDMGGPGCEIMGIRVKGLNIEGGQDLTADASNTPFEDNSIDFIISAHAIEHIKNTRKLFQEWQRILKPGGIIGFVIPNIQYFVHNPSAGTADKDLAPSEMTPGQCREIIEMEAPNLEILMFNTFQNNFEFEGLLRKKL